MKYLTVLTVLFAASALMVGCDDSPKEMLVDGNSVLFFDGLHKDVKILRQVSQKLPGDLTRIRTQFKNTDDDAKWIDIQVVWRDADGMELYKTSWQSFHLPARSIEQYDITSLKPVSSYEFRIRKPDKKGKKQINPPRKAGQ